MTFLELVNFVRTEAGVAGAALSTLSGLTNESGRIKAWVADEWERLAYEREDWAWRKVRGTVAFAVGARTVAFPPAFDGVYLIGATVRLTAGDFSDESPASGVSRDDYLRNVYVGSSRLQTGRPDTFAHDLVTNLLMVWPTPDAPYTLETDFTSAFAPLTGDTDAPAGLPAKFHKIIAHRALMRYGIYYAAPEVVSRAREAEEVLHSELIRTQTPQIQF